MSDVIYSSDFRFDSPTKARLAHEHRERRQRLSFGRVEDRGINLAKERGKGITGWKADAIRQAKEREEERQRLAERTEKIAKAVENWMPSDTPIAPQDGPPSLTLREIQDGVCQFGRVTRNDLLSFRRTRDVVKHRQIAMLLCKMHTVKSLPEIGRAFSNRDHTTVLHAVQKLDGIRKILVETFTPDDPIDVWVAGAYSAWTRCGLKG